jgi:colanic acid/amylovoran biosynthesis glycosyltransferase
MTQLSSSAIAQEAHKKRNLRVGYVMTHYPRTAQTFISGEIDAVERAGASIHCFAMNSPDASELQTADARERHAQTLYLKSRPVDAVLAMCQFFMRHPIAMSRIAFAALRTAGGCPRRMLRRMAHYIQAASVARAVKRREIDHIHAHFGLAPATIAWLASEMASLRGMQVKFSFTIHGFHDFVDPDEARLDIKAKHAAHVVCVSDYTRSQLCRITPPALWPRFSVLRCGVDLNKFVFHPRKLNALSPVILAVGRLSAEKGFSVLIEALAQLHSDNIPARLRLAGDGPLRAALEDAVQGYGLQDYVVFTGEISPSEVRSELENADIFCLPSFNEGLPISIMESMAVGVPVVTTWIAGIPELAENGVTALTVPPADSKALTAAFKTLCGDPNLAADMAINARSRVEAAHDQSSNGIKMAQLLNEISA